MCRFEVTVPACTPVLQQRAVRKLKDIPYRDGAPHIKDDSVSVTIDHPRSFDSLGAAAFAKDWFGLDPELVPSALVL